MWNKGKDNITSRLQKPEKTTENRMSWNSVWLWWEEGFLIVFILITDKTASLTTDTADGDQLFPTKLHPYAF